MTPVPLTGLQTFLAIVEHGSLRAASQALNLKPPAVTQRLKALEVELGVALFIRNTRSLILTDAGRQLRDNATEPMGSLSALVHSVKETARNPRGTLRLSVPYRAFAMLISPHLSEFQERHPDIELDISISENLVDIVSEQFHAGIRLGDHLQDEMVAVRLTPDLEGAVIASPRYLEIFGTPETPDDLRNHRCIQYRRQGESGLPVWRFKVDDETRSVDMGGGLILNDFRSVVDAARDGVGLGYSIRLAVQDDLQTGRLSSVLDRFAVTRPGFHLYFPRAHATLPVLRQFVDFLKTKRRAFDRT